MGGTVTGVEALNRHRQRAVRAFFLLLSASGLWWSYLVIPYHRNDQTFAAFAARVIEGNRLSPSTMEDLEHRLADAEALKLSPPGLVSAMIVRLRVAEDANRSGDRETIGKDNSALDRSVSLALSNVPGDSFGWLVRFWRSRVESEQTPQKPFAYLRQSYALGRNEGWIALRRNRLALSSFDVLPDDLQIEAINEFCKLPASNFVREATDILAEAGGANRGRLLACVADIPKGWILKELAHRGLLDPSEAGKIVSRPWD
jgi:hypothetical protein